FALGALCAKAVRDRSELAAVAAVRPTNVRLSMSRSPQWQFGPTSTRGNAASLIALHFSVRALCSGAGRKAGIRLQRHDHRRLQEAGADERQFTELLSDLARRLCLHNHAGPPASPRSQTC